MFNQCSICLAQYQSRCSFLDPKLPRVSTFHTSMTHCSPLSTFLSPGIRFDHVNLDLVGPLPPSKGYTYLLTMIDRFTHWPEAVPLPDMCADTVARAFVTHWIARFGVLSIITTDHGQQFESTLWKQLVQLIGSNRILTTA